MTSELMIMPPEPGENVVRVKAGGDRTIGIHGGKTVYSTYHQPVFRRLGLYDDGELLADLAASVDYEIDGDARTLTVVAEIELPASPFDAFDVMTDRGEQLDLQEDGDVEELPDDPPTSLPGGSTS